MFRADLRGALLVVFISYMDLQVVFPLLSLLVTIRAGLWGVLLVVFVG